MHFSDYSKEVQWAICVAADPEQIDQIIDKENPAEGLVIDFSINGVKLDFSVFMERLDHALDEAAKKRAYPLANAMSVAPFFSIGLLHDILRSIDIARIHVSDAMDKLQGNYEPDDDN